MRTIEQPAQALAEGGTTSRALVEECLARIADPAGEGARAFIKVHAERRAPWPMRWTRCAGPAARRAVMPAFRSPEGPVRYRRRADAGRVARAGRRAAGRGHAPVVQRMLAAGFVPVGRTNMTEFAFSGLGINPHYGTPPSPWDRAAARIPGGSSSGTAVAVADGMAVAGLGTDTGGSCRIPAAFCGMVGYKPTARRVPIAGVLPLAPSLDSVGPLAPSVACCAIIDAVLAGEDARRVPVPASLAGLRLAVPENIGARRDGRDGGRGVRPRPVGAVSRRRAISASRFPEFDAMPAVNAKGGFAAAEAYAWHRTLLAEKGAGYDPRIRVRIERGERMSAADYLDLVAARARLTAEFDARTREFDAL